MRVVYLIDEYSFLYRAFYALPQSIATTSGLPTNALYGFTSMVLKLVDSEEEIPCDNALSYLLSGEDLLFATRSIRPKLREDEPFLVGTRAAETAFVSANT